MKRKPDFTCEGGWVKGSVKKQQSVTSDWDSRQDLIEGVIVKEMKNVPRENGFLTEIFRTDWELDGSVVDQVFQVMLLPGDLSAWHAHQFTTDRFFASYGLIRLVLFDARSNSPTNRLINEFRLGIVRPSLIVVPPGVWHGVKNLSDGTSCLINLVDRAYSYEDPDHWSLPADTEEIPYSFGSRLSETSFPVREEGI